VCNWGGPAKFKSKPNPRLIIGKVKEAGSKAMVISREQGYLLHILLIINENYLDF
jgi:hypothetical protein